MLNDLEPQNTHVGIDKHLQNNDINCYKKIAMERRHFYTETKRTQQ